MPHHPTLLTTNPYFYPNEATRTSLLPLLADDASAMLPSNGHHPSSPLHEPTTLHFTVLPSRVLHTSHPPPTRSFHGPARLSLDIKITVPGPFPGQNHLYTIPPTIYPETTASLVERNQWDRVGAIGGCTRRK